MLKKTFSLMLCLVVVAVAFIAIPLAAGANNVGPITATVRIEPETLNLASQGCLLHLLPFLKDMMLLISILAVLSAKANLL